MTWTLRIPHKNGSESDREPEKRNHADSESGSLRFTYNAHNPDGDSVSG